VFASSFTGNAASRRALEGLNFTQTGTGLCFSRARQEEVTMTSLVLSRARRQAMKERQR
jgi:hypothetical protein